LTVYIIETTDQSLSLTSALNLYIGLKRGINGIFHTSRCEVYN